MRDSKRLIDTIKDKPSFVNYNSTNMLTIMGSHAYGTNTPTSDTDFYGFVVPPIEYIFPHTAGNIFGFEKNIQNFDQYQGHHLDCGDGYGEYDLTIYSITRYFYLCADGNPNMIDSLFTDNDSLVFVDNVGQMVRDNRKLFLSQKAYHTFRGMAFSHISRLKNRQREGNRLELINKFGYDVKDASHIVRLIVELKQILFEGDLDLKANSKMILGVKNGNWAKEEVISFFEQQMKFLDDIIEEGNVHVPYSPDQKKIKSLLEWCLEENYGSLSKVGYNIYG